MILIWNDIDPGSITPVGDGNRASGGVARMVELYEVFLAEDGRTLTRECRRILGVMPGADDAEELSSPTSIIVDGAHHLIYVGARNGGTQNTVMGAEGRLDPVALPARLLAKADRRRHLTR